MRPETAVDCAEGAEGGSQVILEAADEDQDTETTVAQEDEQENKENHQHQQQHQGDKQESQEGTKDETGSEREKQQEYILEPRDKDGVISYYCSSADCHGMLDTCSTSVTTELMTAVLLVLVSNCDVTMQ